ncbi:DMT family transporter [Streptomyces pacificus]|uniref:Integral membrane protein n=1 Tax=Streptomyces pacificus TaxID=2705029 RepID=A0A6A0AX79_9ACTN|nr:DMT family transporter [Streptomyces pacificus]GFH37550.1 hypothetical protein SCWH03_37880 [Streptomyces pacificus]
MQSLLLPVAFALASALSNATATVLQRQEALKVPGSSGLRPGLMLDLLRRPLWLAGIAAVLVAGVCQALALNTGPLAIVQPLFVLELPLALIIASTVMHRGLPRAGWAAVGLVVVGLGVALAALSPAGNRTQVPLDRWVPALAFCGGAIVVLSAVALRRPVGRTRAALLGTATAISYALTAALMKSATHIFEDEGAAAFFTSWEVYAFAVTGGTALFLLENALQAGPLVASQPALTLGDATLSLLFGVTLYEEHVRTGWWLLPELLGLALITFGVFTLARIPLAKSLVAADKTSGAAPPQSGQTMP